MNIKGISYVTTKTIISDTFGEERWNSFNAKVIEKDKFFSNMIMSVTPIPVDKIIIFFDEMCREFFNNDKTQYAMFGKSGAKFVLSPTGPYKSYLLAHDTKQFVELNMPRIWSTYFDGGTFAAKFENNVAHIIITGFQVKYGFFEDLVMGFNQQALKAFRKKTVATKVRSIASGDNNFCFQLKLSDS
ncbi:MAG: hypothetical protein ABSD50_11690 [Smithella sp.]|jgi:hypothetical protein